MAKRPSPSAAQPAHSAEVAALLQQAMEHHRAGQLPHAEQLYRQILQRSPGHLDATYLLGVLLYQAGQPAQALEFLDQAIHQRPDLAEPHTRRGEALFALSRYQDAIDSFDRALRLNPNVAEACNGRAIALHALGQFKAALDALDLALRLRPDFPEALVNRGLALQALGQFNPAVAAYDHAIRLRPDFVEAHHNRGNALQVLRQFQAAVDAYDHALRLRPEFADAHHNRGLALHQLRRYPAAVDAFDHALKLRPDLADAHCNRAGALYELGRYHEALAGFEHAIRLQPYNAAALQNRGSALNALGRPAEALESVDKALALQPKIALTWSVRAASLQGLARYSEALEACDRALRLDAACFEAYANRGSLLLGLQQHAEAVAAFDRALALYPNAPYVRGMRLQSRRALCDWDGMEAETRDLEARIERGEKATVPFPLLALSASPAVQRRAAEIHARDKFPPPAMLPVFAPRAPRPRIRIGYYSADFHVHAICNLMAGVFEAHDRSRFELFAFSFSNTRDAMTQRVEAAMDHFLDVSALSDAEIATRSRELEIDIAVDLMGFTLLSRTGIFAHRAAPIQVNYLGYPGTMAVDSIHYLIADRTLIPESSRRFYSEKIVTLPDTFQATDSTVALPADPATRAAEGLPADGFVFCCFNSNSKIGPAVFDLWMRILARVPGSILWLLEDNPTAADNLRKQAALRGISPDRLVFARRVPLADHLARQRLAGLFLDTFPFNAGATATPALWAGLPILTLLGETFAGRMAASLLHAIGLPELIAESPEAYEALAVALATDPARLADPRARLDRNRLTSALFDTPRFTRNLEAAYAAMFARHQSGLPPDHLDIDVLKGTDFSQYLSDAK